MFVQYLEESHRGFRPASKSGETAAMFRYIHIIASLKHVPHTLPRKAASPILFASCGFLTKRMVQCFSQFFHRNLFDQYASFTIQNYVMGPSPICQFLRLAVKTGMTQLLLKHISKYLTSPQVSQTLVITEQKKPSCKDADKCFSFQNICEILKKPSNIIPLPKTGCSVGPTIVDSFGAW